MSVSTTRSSASRPGTNLPIELVNADISGVRVDILSSVADANADVNPPAAVPRPFNTVPKPDAAIPSIVNGNFATVVMALPATLIESDSRSTAVYPLSAALENFSTSKYPSWWALLYVCWILTASADTELPDAPFPVLLLITSNSLRRVASDAALLITLPSSWPPYISTFSAIAFPMIHIVFRLGWNSINTIFRFHWGRLHDRIKSIKEVL